MVQPLSRVARGVIALAARCPACGGQVPGLASSRYPGLITVDYHLHRIPWLGICIGSRTPGRKITLEPPQ